MLAVGLTALLPSKALSTPPGLEPRPASATLSIAPQQGAVAADHPLASAAGAELLAKGGNAVDAAVATALALGVVSPMSSGLGGGGFAVVYRAAARQADVLDFRETAPERLPDAPTSQQLRLGGLAVAVPGEPAGLIELHARFGRLPLAAVVAPAIRLAEHGAPVSRAWAAAARAFSNRGALPDGDPLRPLLFDASGAPLVEGALVTRPALARTLVTLAKEGRDGFYTGRVARAIVDEVVRRGGLLRLSDLAGYRPIWRAPLLGRYRQRVLYAAPPPAGGLTAIEALQILDARTSGRGLGPLGRGSVEAQHLLAESLKHAFADRARLLGDPAFTPIPVETLLSESYAAGRAAEIRDDRVAPPSRYGLQPTGTAPVDPPHDKGTTHLSVIDGEGNAVALTTTINLLFGSGVVAEGVVLNDQMDDFAARTAEPNAFGLVGSSANAIAPGKRPLSSMDPLIVVEGGRALLVVGGSGGPHIVSASVQVLLNVLDHGLSVGEAIDAPRLHAQFSPTPLFVEPGLSDSVQNGLAARGHEVVVLGESGPAQKYGGPPHIGVVQAVTLRAERLEAASDARKGGRPSAPAQRLPVANAPLAGKREAP
jgi:gamma-glutamyltranspeptidase/glutathione hydrolase